MSLKAPDEQTRETTAIGGPDGEDAFARWLAEVWDEEIDPPYARYFREILFQNLVLPERGQVLVAGCSTGAIIPDLYKQLSAVGQGRVIALEGRGPLLAKARALVSELDRRRVFLKGESIRKLRFADGVFSVVISNLSWMDLPQPGTALDEFYRVLIPGGKVALTLPLAGTLQEIYDLFAEAALKFDLPDVHRALEQQMKRRHPEKDEASQLLASIGFEDITIHEQEQTLDFSTGRAFFESVLVKALFEPRWRRVAEIETDRLFRYTREAIDTYFVGEPLSVRLVVGCLHGTKPAEAPG